MSRPALLALVALALSLAFPSPAAADEVRQAVDAGNAAFRKALLAGDAKAVADCYTGDALIVPAGAPSAAGRTAIAAYWQAGIDAGIADLALVTTRVERSGELAVEDGYVTVTARDGSVAKNRYLVVWKREAGAWKLHRDIWNAAP